MLLIIINPINKYNFQEKADKDKETDQWITN